MLYMPVYYKERVEKLLNWSSESGESNRGELNMKKEPAVGSNKI